MAEKHRTGQSSLPAHRQLSLGRTIRFDQSDAKMSISIPSNIAEGFGRGSDKELVQFLYISLGSSNELDTQLTVSYELSFITEDKFKEIEKLNNEINKMLQSLIYRRKKGLDSNNLK